MTMNEGKRTLIEEGTELKGTLTSSCPVVVLGRLEGEMTGPSVDVAESGVLTGRAKVTTLRSRGELAGEFDAETVELSGRVRDKTIIRAQSLEVKLERTDGRLEVMFGECELAVGEAPDKAAAIREATSAARAPRRPPRSRRPPPKRRRAARCSPKPTRARAPATCAAASAPTTARGTPTALRRAGARASELSLEISGHTDNVGNAQANKTLSDKRAQACRNYIVSKGIDKKRPDAVGFGDEHPIAPNDTDEGRQKNRRIEAKEL